MQVEHVVRFKPAPGGTKDECRDAEAKQFLSGQIAERKQEQSSQSVKIEDVATPQQDPGIEQAKRDQPEVAAEISVCGIGPAREEDDTGAEQNREEAALRAFETHVDDEPGPQVDARVAAHDGWVVIGGAHAHADDVHDENAEEGTPSNEVQRFQTRSARRRNSIGHDIAPL